MVVFLTWLFFLLDYLVVVFLLDEGEAKLKALFNELDLDGSGEVSSKEWGRNVYKKREALSKFFGGSSLKAIGTLFSVADVDGDESLTFAEFLKLVWWSVESGEWFRWWRKWVWWSVESGEWFRW